MPTAVSNNSSYRRVPRGYGGRSVPNDGNLPRNNARRRRRTNHRDGSEEEGEDVRRSKYDGPPPHLLRREEGGEIGVSDDESIPDEEVEEASIEGGASADVEAGDDPRSQSPPSSSSELSPSSAELSHCLTRARKLRQAILQSNASGSLSSPSNWGSNCLNAIANCVRECSSIYSHYTPEELDGEKCTALSLEIFQLIQLGLQCGPLAGGKPGYFKRCGSEVAKIALDFLGSAVSGEEEAFKLRFSEKQRVAIEKWRVDVTKAVDAGKGPSKSAAKLQKSSKAGKKKKGTTNKKKGR